MKIIAITIATFVTMLAIPAYSQNKADDIIGIWLTGGKEPAKIQIYKSDVKFNGKITWLKNPTENGKQRVDANNPSETKRSNPIIGLVILTGLNLMVRKNGRVVIFTTLKAAKLIALTYI